MPASTSSAIAPTVSSIGVVVVDAVLVVEVDVVDAEPLAATRRTPARTYSASPRMPSRSPFVAAHVAELRGEHDLVAPVGDRAADQLLVRERPVHVGGVEEGDAELERAVDRRDRLVLVGRAVELGHAHAAETDPGRFQPLRPQLPPLHLLPLPRTGAVQP